MKIITGHQPVYLPWLGLLHKASMADTFVFMDDVQYLERDWNNRNRIKGPHGPFWLTVPIKRKASASKLLKDTIINSDGAASSSHYWQLKHWRSLQLCYKGSPYWDEHATFFERIYVREPWKWLVDINRTILDYLLAAFGINVEIVVESERGFEGEKSALVLDHCRKLDADICVFGTHGREYVVEQDFRRHDITTYYQDYSHPIYPQRFGSFASHLSAVDLLFNCGPKSYSVMISGNVTKEHLFELRDKETKPGHV